MDDYGISSALHVALQSFVNGQRASGRTTNFINSIEAGDVIIVPTQQIYYHIRQELTKRNLSPQIIICHGGDLKLLVQKLQTIVCKRIRFEHTWIEEYFYNCIENSRNELKTFTQYLQQPQYQEQELWLK